MGHWSNDLQRRHWKFRHRNQILALAWLFIRPILFVHSAAKCLLQHLGMNILFKCKNWGFVSQLEWAFNLLHSLDHKNGLKFIKTIYSNQFRHLAKYKCVLISCSFNFKFIFSIWSVYIFSFIKLIAKVEAISPKRFVTFQLMSKYLFLLLTVGKTSRSLSYIPQKKNEVPCISKNNLSYCSIIYIHWCLIAQNL